MENPFLQKNIPFLRKNGITPLAYGGWKRTVNGRGDAA
jgi:hypothetical protein